MEGPRRPRSRQQQKPPLQPPPLGTAMPAAQLQSYLDARGSRKPQRGDTREVPPRGADTHLQNILDGADALVRSRLNTARPPP
eukprot:SAG22_NODE_17107_length_311_cov_0.948113_1_plen_82_part_10